MREVRNDCYCWNEKKKEKEEEGEGDEGMSTRIEMYKMDEVQWENRWKGWERAEWGEWRRRRKKKGEEKSQRGRDSHLTIHRCNVGTNSNFSYGKWPMEWYLCGSRKWKVEMEREEGNEWKWLVRERERDEEGRGEGRSYGWEGCSLSFPLQSLSNWTMTLFVVGYTSSSSSLSNVFNNFSVLRSLFHIYIKWKSVEWRNQFNSWFYRQFWYVLCGCCNEYCIVLKDNVVTTVLREKILYLKRYCMKWVRGWIERTWSSTHSERDEEEWLEIGRVLLFEIDFQ